MRMRAIGCLLLAACSGIDSDPGGGDLVVQDVQPSQIALGGDDLYYVSAPSSGGYRVLRVAKTGGAPELVGSAPVIFAIAANATGVYWVESEDGGTTRLMGRDRTAPDATELGTNPNTFNGSTLRNLALDGGTLYYADVQGSVWKTSVTGDGSVELGKTDTSAGAIAIAPDGIWVSTLHGAKKFPKAGGSATEISIGGEHPDELAFGGDRLFAAFAGSGGEDGKILAVPGSGMPSMIASGLVLPASLVAAGDSLYFTTGNTDAAIRRVSQSGGSADALAGGLRPSAVVVDEELAYWTDPPRGEIRKVPR